PRSGEHAEGDQAPRQLLKSSGMRLATCSRRLRLAGIAYFPALTIDLLILDFNTLDGLNTRTCRGRIGTSSPVLGLRPIRSFLERTWNEPNEDSLTLDPSISASPISSRTRSTSSADSVRESPTVP